MVLNESPYGDGPIFLETTSQRDKSMTATVVLSVLLHSSFFLIFFLNDLFNEPVTEPTGQEQVRYVELVEEPPTPVKPEVQPETPEEKPPLEEDKPKAEEQTEEAASSPPPPVPAPAKPEPQFIPKPQLEGGKVVEKKREQEQEAGLPDLKEAKSEKPEISIVENLDERDVSAFVIEKKVEGKGENPLPKIDSEESLTQSERDFLLAQIFEYWRFTYRVAEASELTLSGSVVVLPNGMLAAPYAGDLAWNPAGDMPQYAEAVQNGNELVKRALESFYRALRMSQPLDLPSDTSGNWPKRISVSFHFKDVLDKY